MKIIILLLLLIIVHPSVMAGTYEILKLKGELQIFRQGVLVNSPIQDGDTIRVSKGGLLILKGQGVLMKLSGETEIKPFIHKEEGWVDLVKGMIVSHVVKKKFKVNSKAVSFAVRGTKFFVSADDSDQAWMCVNEGVVAATNKIKTIEVTKGYGVSGDSKNISSPQSFAWTKGINWDLDSTLDLKDHQINLNYDILENIYD